VDAAYHFKEKGGNDWLTGLVSREKTNRSNNNHQKEKI
jgi:hypothetical protein